MNRIFYFNINYICNNKCRFCFSYNTYTKLQYTISIKNIIDIIKLYNINKFDRVVINGGEPTLNKDLADILSVLHKSNVEIILYSNGILMSNLDYCKDILSKINRVVIPIHGNLKNHEYITQNYGSYNKTIKAIKNIIQIGYSDKIELKFIVTNNMIQEYFSIPEFLKNFNTIKNLVITNQVNTKIARNFNFIPPDQKQFCKYISKQLLELIGKYSIKIIECKICHLNSEVIHIIQSMDDGIDENFNEYIFFDGKFIKGKNLEYNSNEFCNRKQCVYNKYCRSIIDSCRVFHIGKEYKNLVIE